MSMTDNSRLIARRRRQDVLFNVLGILCTLICVVTLLALLTDLLSDGLSRIDWQFLTSFASRRASRAGILAAWAGSVLLMLVTIGLAVPLGVAAGVYLEEYARKTWITTIIEINIANLAGVPSIIYGLLALGVLVYGLHLGQSVLVGGITLALLVLPIVIVCTREALRAIPRGIREAAYALGATKWEVVKDHLLPYSAGGIATGTIIAMSRAIGETAPLITIGALSFIAFLPPSPLQSQPPFVNFEWLHSEFSALPIQMFNWVSRPNPEFHRNAAAAGIVLILMTLSLNAVAIAIRYRLRRRIKW
jgi:phosphate transport system permease protein